MLAKQKLFKSILTIVGLLFIVTGTYAKAPNQQSFQLQISNYSGFHTTVPAHNIRYKSSWTQDWTYGPVEKTMVPDETQTLLLWRPDDQSISTDIVITDPAEGDRDIFKAQIYYDPIDGRFAFFIKKSDENYMIVPTIRERSDKFGASISIQVYDRPLEPGKPESYISKK